MTDALIVVERRTSGSKMLRNSVCVTVTPCDEKGVFGSVIVAFGSAFVTVPLEAPGVAFLATLADIILKQEAPQLPGIN